MIGGLRFAAARARAATAPLATLAVVAALSALLIVAVSAVISAVETREVRAALAAVDGDRAQTVLTVETGAPADPVARAAVDALGHAAAGFDVTVAGRSVVLTPDTDVITSAQALALADGLGRLRDDIDERTGARPQESGGLGATLAAAREGIEVRRGPSAVALGLLGLLTGVVIAAVALEPVRARADETTLLRARGARRREVAALAATEAFIVGLAGAAVGATVAAALAALWGHPAVPLVVAAAVVALPAIAAVVAAVVTARGVDRRSSRARRVADTGALVLLAVLAAVAVWRFAQAGTPIVVRGDGEAVLDPLVAVAPSLALGLAALAAVAVATPVARVLGAAFAPSRGIEPVTPMLLASRRPARHALSITVVAFAVGAITLAAAYQSSLTALGAAPEELRVGTDVRVGTIPEDVSAADVAAAGSPDASMLARPLSAEGAQGRIPVLAVQAARLADVMHGQGSDIDPAALAADLALPATDGELSGRELTVTLAAPPTGPVEIDGELVERVSPALQVQVTVVSASGVVETFAFTNAEILDDGSGPFPAVDARARQTASFALPDGEAWSLASFAVSYHPLSRVPGRAVITRVASGADAVDLSDFRPAAGTPGVVGHAASTLTFEPEASQGEPFTRAVAPFVPAVVPTVVTADLAASMSLDPGDTIALELVRPAFDAEFEIVDIVPILPGTPTGEGMLVDLGVLAMSSPVPLPPTQAWLSTGDPDAAAAAVGEAYPQTVTTIADPRAADNAAGTSWAFFLAAGGAFVLAAAVLALRRTRSRADSRELALLAVLGLGRARASRLRAHEDLFAVVLGAVGGIAAGFATAALVIAPLVRAAYGSVPEAYPVDLRVDPLTLSLVIAAAVGVFAAIVASVRAPAHLAPLLREDE